MHTHYTLTNDLFKLEKRDVLPKPKRKQTRVDTIPAAKQQNPQAFSILPWAGFVVFAIFVAIGAAIASYYISGIVSRNSQLKSLIEKHEGKDISKASFTIMATIPENTSLSQNSIIEFSVVALYTIKATGEERIAHFTDNLIISISDSSMAKVMDNRVVVKKEGPGELRVTAFFQGKTQVFSFSLV
ncbi:MAG: hypothetical protein FWG10_07685 [Eubacteriaceae bacterium]|nr:hypothetical protein [Eubacteriaceae bacterium]